MSAISHDVADATAGAGIQQWLVSLTWGYWRGDRRLAKRLHNCDPLLRFSAAHELNEEGWFGAGPTRALMTALGDSDSAVRREAAEALGRGKHTDAILLLRRLLRDSLMSDPSVAFAAAWSIISIAGPPSIARYPECADAESEWLLTAYWLSKGDSRNCAQSGERALEALLAAVKDPTPLPARARRNARYLEAAAVRRAAAEALGRLGDRRAVEPLVSALRDRDSDVRRTAADALDRLGWEPERNVGGAAYWLIRGDAEKCAQVGKPPLPLLIAALDREQPAMRSCAIETLARIGDPAVEPLIVALRNKDLIAACGAAEALGRIGDARALGPLIAFLKGNHDPFRSGPIMSEYSVRVAAAVEPLANIGDRRAAQPLLAAFFRHGLQDARIIRALDRLGATQELIAACKATDDRVRTEALHALAGTRDVGAFETLMAALKHKDSGVRSASAKALGNIGDVRAVEALIRVLGNRKDGTRIAAAEALGKLGDQRAVEPLIGALSEWQKDHRVRLYGIDPYVRAAAAEALGRLGDIRAVEPLIALHRQLVRTLWYWGSIHFEGTEWSDVSAEIVRAARALGKLRDARAVDTLIAAIGDPYTGHHDAIEALAEIGLQAASKLRTMLNDGSDSSLWSAAAEVIHRLSEKFAQLPCTRPQPSVLFDGDCKFVEAESVRLCGKITNSVFSRSWIEFDRGAVLNNIRFQDCIFRLALDHSRAWGPPWPELYPVCLRLLASDFRDVEVSSA